MKIRLILPLTILFVLAATLLFADDFSPTLLKITGEDVIRYDFSGEGVEIPVTVSGTPVQLVYAIYTKDKAREIADIENGYLDWHYVNKVDTCLYYSTPYQFEPGSHVVTWDGCDQDGAAASPGEYTYYLWGFDNVSKKQMMSEHVYWKWGVDIYTAIQELDGDGLPLANPIWYRYNTRWNVGSDPHDESLLSTTTLSFEKGWRTEGEPALIPNDPNIMFTFTHNQTEKMSSIQKYRFVPGGDAEFIMDWGAEAPYATKIATQGSSAGVIYDEPYLYTTDDNHTASEEPDAQFYIYDSDGVLLHEIDLTSWWSSAYDFQHDAQMNGGPNNFYLRDTRVLLNSHASCMVQMVDPVRFIESGEVRDFFVWSNGNGDYVLDKNYEEDADKKWVCNDYNVFAYKYSLNADSNLFSVNGIYDYNSPRSFALLGPDGTGIGNFFFAGQTDGFNSGVMLIDAGGSFDGLYCDNMHTGGPYYNWERRMDSAGIFYVAQDSFRGRVVQGSDYISIKTPEKGERVAAGLEYTIRWYASNIGTVRVEYSADNGANWTLIDESADATSGVYRWQVPDTTSSECLIRLTDTDNQNVQAMSRGTFSICQPFVEVLEPSAGKVFKSWQIVDVTWDYIGVEKINLEYSADNGLSWHIFAAEVNASEKKAEWVVPEQASDEYLLRISDSSNPEVADIIDDTIAVQSSFVKLINPNGGEIIDSRLVIIRLNMSNDISAIDLYYSIDEGVTWRLIAENVPSGTKPLWSVPVVESSGCLLKVVSSENDLVSDISDTFFSIKPSQWWYCGWTTWRERTGLVDDTIDAVCADNKGSVWISTDGAGVSYYDGLEWKNYTEENTGVDLCCACGIVVDHDDVAWFVKSNGGLVSYDGKTWQSHYGGPRDGRDIVVDKENNLWIGSGSSGIWRYDRSQWTNWSSKNSPIKNATPQNLAVGADNTIWIAYRHGYDVGVANFNGETLTHFGLDDGLPNNTVYCVEVDSDGSLWIGTDDGLCRYDGENWQVWKTEDGLLSNRIRSLAVDYDGVLWIGAFEGICSFDGDTFQTYTTQNSSLESDSIRDIAVDINNGKWFATNHGGVTRFSYGVGPYVRVKSPDGNELLLANSTVDIEWLYRDVESVNLEYSADNGETWTTIATGIDASLERFKWHTPAEATNGALIRVSDSSIPERNDESNLPFRISKPFVRVISPNGAEIVPEQKIYNVRWESVGIESLDLELSVDGGTTWLKKLSGIAASEGVYSWRVDAEISENCLIKLVDSADSEHNDVGDREFRIVETYIEVLSPNGGEDYTNTAGLTISWKTAGIESLKIEYSVDGGLTWNYIYSVMASKLDHYWNPMQVESRLYKVRISDASDSSISDESDGVFHYSRYVSVDSQVPEVFSVAQNSPNPFNPSTVLNFTLPETRYVSVDVYSLNGQRVARLVDDELPAGRHSVTWDAGGMSAGIYLCRIHAGMDVKTVKMMLMK